MVDLKTSLCSLRAMFRPEAEARMRPLFFRSPNPRPSGHGDLIKARRSGWKSVAVLDPAVLEAVGIDPERFGICLWPWGRTHCNASVRHRDIRWMYENDAASDRF